MKRVTALFVAALVGAAAIVAMPAAAGAVGATQCTGFLPGATYGSIVVPSGATCVLGDGTVVRGGIAVQPTGSLIMGPATVGGGVKAKNPESMIIHNVTINGGISIKGGSGPAPEGCESEDCVYFTAIEDSQINGGATVDGYNGFWLGFIRNQVGGGVNLSNNNQLDPDASEYVSNVIHGGMACWNDTPAPHGGDSGGVPNVVMGKRSGGCFAGFELLP